MKLAKENSKKQLLKRGPTPSTITKPSNVTNTEREGEEEVINYEDFDSDEEPEEDKDTQKDDMKLYLGKLNTRIDKICVALK